MRISSNDWKNYIARLRNINDTAANKIIQYIDKNGLTDRKELLDYAYAIVNKYGEASSALSARMYDTIAELSGKHLPDAEPAAIGKYGDVAKAINGTLKTSVNSSEIANAAARWVKMAGSDTMLKNAIRDRAEFAWIPQGETCAFCLMLASNGWQPISKKALKNGHAEHIHSNCDCQYAIRFDESTDVEGYDPDKYKKMYYGAEGDTTKEKLNSLRKRLSDNEGPFRTVDERRNEDRKSIIKPHNVIKNLESTQVGNEALSLIDKNNVNVNFVYGRDNVINGQPLLGYYDLEDNSITIFADKTQNIMDTAKVVVHEAFHLDDYGPCQKSEVLCMSKELMHEKNTTSLTKDESDGIIKKVREMYWFLPWEC